MYAFFWRPPPEPDDEDDEDEDEDEGADAAEAEEELLLPLFGGLGAVGERLGGRGRRAPGDSTDTQVVESRAPA